MSKNSPDIKSGAGNVTINDNIEIFNQNESNLPQVDTIIDAINRDESTESGVSLETLAKSLKTIKLMRDMKSSNLPTYAGPSNAELEVDVAPDTIEIEELTASVKADDEKGDKKHERPDHNNEEDMETNDGNLLPNVDSTVKIPSSSIPDLKSDSSSDEEPAALERIMQETFRNFSKKLSTEVTGLKYEYLSDLESLRHLMEKWTIAYSGEKLDKFNSHVERELREIEDSTAKKLEILSDLFSDKVRYIIKEVDANKNHIDSLFKASEANSHAIGVESSARFALQGIVNELSQLIAIENSAEKALPSTINLVKLQKINQKASSVSSSSSSSSYLKSQGRNSEEDFRKKIGMAWSGAEGEKHDHVNKKKSKSSLSGKSKPFKTAYDQSESHESNKSGEPTMEEKINFLESRMQNMKWETRSKNTIDRYYISEKKKSGSK